MNLMIISHIFLHQVHPSAKRRLPYYHPIHPCICLHLSDSEMSMCFHKYIIQYHLQLKLYNIVRLNFIISPHFDIIKIAMMKLKTNHHFPFTLYIAAPNRNISHFSSRNQKMNLIASIRQQIHFIMDIRTI